jgi:hypothetical protein
MITLTISKRSFQSWKAKRAKFFTEHAKSFFKVSMLELKRAELDHLWKFLFLMKYRNTGMFDWYNHDHVNNYDADGRE